MVRSLTTLCVFLLTSFCGGAYAAAPAAAGGKPLPVVVSLPAQKYLVEKIGGDAVSVTVLLQKGADPHTFEPSPSQMRAVADAALYYSIGLPFEDAWLPRIAGSTPNLTVVSMIAGIKRLSVADDALRLADLGLSGNAEPHAGQDDHDDHGEDPHVWLSPMLVRAMLPNIVKSLAAKRPEDAPRFRAAAKALDAELQALDVELAEVFAPIPGDRRVFLTLHPAWRYFAHNYELTEISVETNGKEPSPRDMKAVIDLARKFKLRTVFVEAQFPRAAAEAVAKNIGATVVILDPLAEDLPTVWRSAAAAFAASFTQDSGEAATKTP